MYVFVLLSVEWAVSVFPSTSSDAHKATRACPHSLPAFTKCNTNAMHSLQGCLAEEILDCLLHIVLRTDAPIELATSDKGVVDAYAYALVCLIREYTNACVHVPAMQCQAFTALPCHI